MATVSSRFGGHHSGSQPINWKRHLQEMAVAFAVAGGGVATLLLTIEAVRQHRSPLSLAARIPVLVAQSFRAEPPLPSLVPASKPMMHAVRNAVLLESHGVFGEEARDAWRKAAEECQKLSLQPIASPDGQGIHLWMLEVEEDRAAELAAMLDGPVETPQRAEALRCLHEQAVANAARIRQYREILNYDYWKAVCEAEGTSDALQAREALWRADHEAEAGHLEIARSAYEEALAAWKRVLETSPVLERNDLMIEELNEIFGRYRTVLEKLGTPAADPLVLDALVGGGGAEIGRLL